MVVPVTIRTNTIMKNYHLAKLLLHPFQNAFPHTNTYKNWGCVHLFECTCSCSFAGVCLERERERERETYNNNYAWSYHFCHW